MKKLLVVLLAFVMVFSFAACGEQENTNTADEGLTAIPLGGNLGEYELEGEGFGSYSEIDFSEDADLSGVSEAHLYYSEGSNVPFIAVYRWANDEGLTLEEEAAALCEEYDTTRYQMCSWEALGNIETGFYTMGYTDKEGNYYYVECDLMLDGDEFVEIDFLSSTEEIALGDSGKYLWVPTGYTDMMNDEETEHGTAFYGEYDESYYLPGIWVGLEPISYEDRCWYLSDDFDEIPFDEATYNKWVATDWDEASCEAYYKAIGIKDVKYYEHESDGIKMSVCACENENGFLDEIYFTIDGVQYTAVLYTDLVPEPIYAKVLINSLHSK